MGRLIGRDAVDGYVWLDTAHVQLSGGPDRVVTTEPATITRRPIGFAPIPRHRLDVPTDSPSRATEHTAPRHRAEQG